MGTLLGIRSIRLDALLRLRGIPQSLLAERAGITPRTIQRITMDPTYEPHEETWTNLARELRCSRDWLRWGIGEPLVTPAGRLALCLHSRGWNVETLAAACRDRVPVSWIRGVLDESTPWDPIKGLHIANALEEDAHWLAHGPLPAAPRKNALVEALKIALQAGGTIEEVAARATEILQPAIKEPTL